MTLVITFFNSEKTLKRCIESVLAQTYKNIEVVLVDDGSTDNSNVIAQDYSNKYPNFKLISKSNTGLADSINVGIKNASGSIIGFLDSDDWVNYDMYKQMIDFMTLEQADICVCGFYQVYGNCKVNISKDIERMTLDGNEAIKYLFDYRYANYRCNKIFLKELFDDIKFPSGKYFEDMYTTYKLFLKAKKVAFHNNSFYYYDQKPGSITLSSNKKAMYDEIQALEEMCSIESVDLNKSFIAGLFLNTVIKHRVRNYKKSTDKKEVNKYTSEILNKYCGNSILNTKQKFKKFIGLYMPFLYTLRYKFSDSASPLYGRLKLLFR